MTKTRFWTEMTWRDFQAADMAKTIAVLPIAAVEQHGPHLPVGADVYVMDFYLRRVVDRLPPDLAAIFLPVQSIGVSSEHCEFPGALSLSLASATAALKDIAESVYRTGCRKLIIVDSHAAPGAMIEAVARELRAQLGILCVVASWGRFGYPDGLFPEQETRQSAHGGAVETSLTLAARADLVRRAELGNFEPARVEMERDFTWLRASPPIGFASMAQDLHESGAAGDASLAAAEKGEAAADYGATAFIELLQDVEAFDLTRLGAGPLA